MGKKLGWVLMVILCMPQRAHAEGGTHAAYQGAVEAVAYLRWVRQGSPLGAQGQAVASRNFSHAQHFVQTYVVRRGGGLGRVSESSVNVMSSTAHALLGPINCSDAKSRYRFNNALAPIR